MEMVRILLEYQTYQLLQYIPVTVAIEDKLLTPVLSKTNVALEDNLSKELSNDDLEKCVYVEETYL